VNLPITYNEVGYGLYKTIASTFFYPSTSSNSKTNNLTISPNSDSVYYVDSADNRPYLRTLLSRYLGDKTQTI
jgi:hypothetical protein